MYLDVVGPQPVPGHRSRSTSHPRPPALLPCNALALFPSALRSQLSHFDSAAEGQRYREGRSHYTTDQPAKAVYSRGGACPRPCLQAYPRPVGLDLEDTLSKLPIDDVRNHFHGCVGSCLKETWDEG